MGKIIFVLLVLLGLAIVVALPLYFLGNLVLLVLSIPFHLTLLQAFVISIATLVLKQWFFPNQKNNQK